MIFCGRNNTNSTINSFDIAILKSIDSYQKESISQLTKSIEILRHMQTYVLKTSARGCKEHFMKYFFCIKLWLFDFEQNPRSLAAMRMRFFYFIPLWYSGNFMTSLWKQCNLFSESFGIRYKIVHIDFKWYWYKSSTTPHDKTIQISCDNVL